MQGEKLLLRGKMQGDRHFGRFFWEYDGTVKDTVKVGRNHSEIIFPMMTDMSTVHAKFTFAEGRWYFEDFKSLNGSWLLCKNP